jgi:mono/diheme cytochrome c family protein
MANVMRCARATTFSIMLVVGCGYALSAVTCHTAVIHASPRFSFITTPTSGQEEYTAYCAGCHGQDGRGKGRSSAYCSVPPADLTQLAQRNNGIYPAEWICEVLRHGTGHAPRGQGYMPTWEPLLKSMNGDPPGVTEVRIQSLAAFIRTLQDQPSGAKKQPSAAK